MTQYLIHTCSKRLWYVEDFLIPSMKKQGITDKEILIYNDCNNEGQLTSLLKSYDLVKDADVWHLQDDIIISSRFKEATDTYNDDIVCGFCNSFSKGQPGCNNVYNMWYSMPCIRISGEIFTGFINWMRERDTQTKFRAYFSENKHDDVLLEFYLREKCAKIKVYNIAPNIVNHIDHLIGGSLINKSRDKSIQYIMSSYWDEPELLVDIERQLNDRHN